jgi:hypothetical protein
VRASCLRAAAKRPAVEGAQKVIDDLHAHLPLTTNPGNKKNVSTARFIRSIKNAPTIGTTTKACGAGPWRRVSACMLAIAVAVAPIAKPQKAPEIIALS